MDIPGLTDELQSLTRLSFTLSGGPGGQNVNKVHTRVTGHLPLTTLTLLTPDQVDLVRSKLSSRINSEDELFLSVQRHRTQRTNRVELFINLEALILGALKKTPPRRRTKPTRASKERRLNSKKLKSRRKQDRNYRFD